MCQECRGEVRGRYLKEQLRIRKGMLFGRILMKTVRQALVLKIAKRAVDYYIGCRK
jgi:hypothetical protein